MGVPAPGDEDGTRMVDRGAARVPVGERQQRVTGPAGPVHVERVLVLGGLALGAGKRRGVPRHPVEAEERPVWLLRRMPEPAVKAMKQDQGAALGDRRPVAPEAEGERQSEVGREERVWSLPRE